MGIFNVLANKGLLNCLPDKLFLKLTYRSAMKKRLNIDEPRTFNEKIQWLKIYDRKPEYASMVDKYEVKKFVASIIGEQYIIPTLGVWEHFDEIDFDTLPEKFVLKCTHDSGGLIIVRDKSKLDKSNAKKKIEKSLKKNYYNSSREWPYKNVKPRIIAEEYMEDVSKGGLLDYKFFCFNGVVKALFIASDRNTPNEDTKFDFYDAGFNHLPIKNGHENAKFEIKCPKEFEEMKRLSAQLSAGLPHVRVDLYDINGKVYFGEMTFFHWGGFVPFEPEEWDNVFGSWIELPDKKTP